MNQLQYKTNINCSSCVATIKPHLDSLDCVFEWNVDTANKNKVLTIQSKENAHEQIMETVQKAGFKIELLTN